nr:MAG TPA: hypothetical protein [Caudoviricetes sp.]
MPKRGSNPRQRTGGTLRSDDGKPKASISVPCETWRRSHRPESVW